ncbi:MAG: tail-specific protease [Proteobacteria bacterium]|nr:MAG: tail-specific protease [Pseudomonadota bacterium]
MTKFGFIDRIAPLLTRLRRGAGASMLALAATVLVLTALPAGNAPANTDPQGSMSIEKKHMFVARLIRNYMERRHYVKMPIDDDLSVRVLNRYVETLDPERMYFLQQDVSKFDEIRYEFDEFIEQSRLEPAFAIFLVYRTRVRNQVDTALTLIDKPFDFTRDEYFDVDREDEPWAKTQDELDELWRKRVKNDLLGLIISGKQEDEARETLKKRYTQMRHRTEQLNANDVFQFYTNAYLLSVEPHTSYLSPRASENFRIRMSLSLEGIGAVLQSENEYTKVTRVVTGGPADMSGELRAGDRIVGVGQGDAGEITDVIGWRLDDVVELIRGPKGSVVQLRVLPEKAVAGGDTHVISIMRDKINLEEQAAKKSLFEFEHAERTYKLGVIDVPTFYADFEGRSHGDPEYRSTTKDVRELINELKNDGIDALIVDLRGNGGGALSEAISLTGLFIESGPIVQVRDTSGRVRVNVDPDPSVSYTGPLAVMVDRNSASASEIFAGAIQDYQRGLVIGEPTFGKGTVQNLVPLGQHSRTDVDLGQLKLTVAQFFRVNGDSTQHRGVVPDILFPIAMDSDQEGERSYDNALPWSRIPAADYEPQYTLGDSALLAELARRFDDRKDESDGLRYLREAEEFTASSQQVEQLSLNLETRKRQLEQRRERSTAIENELRRSRGLPPIEKVSDNDLITESDPTSDGDDGEFPPDVLLEEAGHILADLISLKDHATRLAHTGTDDTVEARN